jgi:uncharacterized protein YbjT (DUF2867 family)
MIVITTPTGTIGRQVLDNVLQADAPARVIVRDPSRLAREIRERVEIVEGSTGDAAVVNKAFAGADAVFWIVPPDQNTDDLAEYYYRFNTIAADAIKAQHVQRIVWISTLGSDTSKPAGPLSAALVADKPLEDTGVAARILDPATFMDNLLRQTTSLKEQNRFSWPNAADQVLHNIATRDIAAKAAQLLLDSHWIGQERVSLVGPDNLTPNEMAEIMSEVLGKPIHFEYISPEDYKASMLRMGVKDTVAQDRVDMAVAVNAGFYMHDAAHAQRTTTSFRTWCQEVLKPAILR